MKSQLWAARITNISGQYFIPIDKVEALLAEENVKRELSRCEIKLSGQTLEEILDEVCIRSKVDEFDSKSTYVYRGSRRRVFAILVLIGKSADIQTIIHEGVRDSDLPLVKVTGQLGRIGLARGIEGELLSGLNHWPPKAVEEFLNHQFEVISPYFAMPTSREPSRVLHYPLEEQVILPWVKDESGTSSGPDISGGFGKVWEVKIHPAHHNFNDKSVRFQPFLQTFGWSKR